MSRATGSELIANQDILVTLTLTGRPTHATLYSSPLLHWTKLLLKVAGKLRVVDVTLHKRRLPLKLGRVTAPKYHILVGLLYHTIAWRSAKIELLVIMPLIIC